MEPVELGLVALAAPGPLPGRSVLGPGRSLDPVGLACPAREAFLRDFLITLAFLMHS